MEENMTTKEVAEILGTSPNVVTENGKKLFPTKEVQKGKSVNWTEESFKQRWEDTYKFNL